MEFDSLVHDPDKVTSAILKGKQKDKIIAVEDTKIIFPKTWVGGKLGSLDSKWSILCFFAIVIGDKSYGVTDAMCKMSLTPENVSIEKHNGSEYYVLGWSKGSVICPNTFLVRDNQLAFGVFDEFTAKGKTPFYMDLSHVTNMFKTANTHATVNLMASPSILALYAAVRARKPGNLGEYSKELIKSVQDASKASVHWIPLTSVAYGATSTWSKFNGGYLDEGISSSLVNPSQEIQPLEQIILT